MVVSDKELEFDDDQRCWFEEKPFTGVAVQDFRNGAREETEYIDGFQSGLDRQWDGNGILVAENEYLKGVIHGKAREWYKTGQLKSEARCEFGIELAFQAWDEAGKLSETRQLVVGTSCERMLNEKRAAR